MRKRMIRKRILSVLTAFAIVCSGLSLSPFAQPGIVKAAESEETEEEYTPITNVSELYAIRNNLSGKYRLMNDIDLTEATSEGGEVNNTGHGWTPIDNFGGVLDGNGHVIKGMKIYGEVSGDIGLFGATGSHVEIRNLGIIDVDIDVTSSGINCGSLFGFLKQNYLNIDDCFVSGTIKINGTKYSKTGGFVGKSDGHLTITDSYNLAKIVSVDGEGEYCSGTGGFSGANYYSYGAYATQVINCYNVGVINAGMGYGIGPGLRMKPDRYSTGCVNIFFLVGTASEGEGTPLTEAQMKNMNYFTGWDFDTVWEIDSYSTYKYPQLRSCRQKRVKSLTVETLPKKIEYDQGDPLELTDATLKVVYEDGHETVIFLTEDMLGDYDMMLVGKQQIPIYKQDVSTTIEITVNAIPVTGMKMGKSSTAIYKGYTEKLTASVLPENATDQSITWSSADETVATVSQDGTITGKKAGTTTIRATSENGVTAECKVTVTIPCTDLQLGESEITMDVGDTCMIAYEMLPEDATDVVTWISEDETVVTTNEDDDLVGVGVGTVKVTAVAGSGVTAVCTVTVMQELSECTVSEIKDVTYTGAALTPALTVTDGTRTLCEGEDYSLKYSSNTDVGTATVKITGLGFYKGTLTREFRIVSAEASVTQADNSSVQQENNNPGEDKKDAVQPVQLSKAKFASIKASKKKLVIQWKQVKNASGYKIEIAKNRSFTKGKKVYTAGKNTLKRTFKGTKKTTYYIRVQAYAYNAEGRISYGGYSSVKKKKTK